MTEQTQRRELSFSRVIDAPREKIFRCWTEEELLKQWFAPLPWTVSAAKIDVRAGGSSSITMRSPEGEEYPGNGVYLEVIPNERIVFTDAFASAWVPSAKPFMVVTTQLDDLGSGKTRYTATVLHWAAEDREVHEKMGFHRGWAQGAEQLAALAAKI
ncbi:SRPBCC family protein [Rhizobium miluonense]|uniref:Uncharacterized conserved protein YndB, AHSA1/START domain n=1 Tax=Rhizobium miluonense TaxID=411945 RepID=A0A1C3WUG8_9HYPH|nr:SRPBCC family protein [Rhizobium miluonense]SCB43565.1 Uncharacterized conserved protein YndB, AHSA1/START domain [Rhizobium miluonense]